MRGDPLKVTVSSSVNWLQPTYILPKLIFPGGASERLKEEVRDDMREVLEYFTSNFGVQADPFVLEVLFAKDVNALIEYYKADEDADHEFDEEREAALRALWDRAGGWAGGHELVLKQESWKCAGCTGRHVLTHEYFHELQGQLPREYIWGTTWLTEGTAVWVQMNHRLDDRKFSSFNSSRSGAREETAKGPTLESTAAGNATWQYPLGLLATDLLGPVHISA